MAKRLAIPSKELQLHIIGKRGSAKASRVQRLTLNTDIPSTTIDEIGSSSHVGDVKDIPNITLTFSAFDVGINVFAALTGTDPDAYPGAGVDIQSVTDIDGIIYIKSDTARRWSSFCCCQRL